MKLDSGLAACTGEEIAVCRSNHLHCAGLWGIIKAEAQVCTSFQWNPLKGSIPSRGHRSKRRAAHTWEDLRSMSVGYQGQAPGQCRPSPLSMRRLSAGRVLKDFPRDKIKITSKWGPIFGAEGHSSDMRPAHARASCEASLKRLGTDYLDMMIFRGPARDPHGTPIEDCIKGMAVWTNVLVPLH